MGKAEDTKARVERAALTLFVARGVAETTTKEIAMAASIAEGTIYRYFPSKEQLARDLFLRHHRALAEALSEAQRAAKGLRAKIDAIVRCYCEWADRDWTLFAYHLLNQHSFLIQVPDDTPNPVNVVREVIALAMKAGEIPRRNVDLAAASAIGVVLQAATYKVYGRFTGELSAHRRFFADAAWAVLAIKEPRKSEAAA
jgi:AcrR family transcriptional regulator